MAATLPGTMPATPPATRPATRVSETSSSPHPLDPLTVAELEVAAQVLVRSGRLGERPLLAWMALLEPPKAAVTTWRAGEPPLARHAMCVAVDRATGTTYEAVVDVTSGEILRADPQPGRHAPIQPLEWIEAGPAVRSDARVQAALIGRGIDPDTVEVEPWPAAYFDEEVDRLGRRIGRAVLFVRERDGDNLWARPVEGLLVIADRSSGEVLEVRDSGAVALPVDPGRMDVDDVAHRHQAPLRHPARRTELPAGRTPAHLAALAHAAVGAPGRGPRAPRHRLRRPRHRAPRGRSATGPRSARWWCPTPTPGRSTTGATCSTPARPRSAATRRL